MLIITNYNNLLKNYGSSQTQSLLNKVNEIANTQNGTIYYTDGANSPIEIRQRIIQQAGEITGLKYIMIVGGEEIIPFWQPSDPTGDEQYILSDYYYSDLNFDGFADVSIGRIIGDEVNDMISLLDASTHTNNGKKAIVAGDDLGVDDTKQVAQLFTKSYFSTNELYRWLNLIFLPFNIQDKSIIYHIGHADWWIWTHKWAWPLIPSYLMAWKVRLFGLGNTHPIVHTVGCHAGLVRSWMGDWTSIPLAFIDRGAVAYIGGTGYHYFWPSDLLGKLFITSLLDGQDLGTSLKNSKLTLLKTNPYSTYVKKVILEHTLYGNPKFKPTLPSQSNIYSINVSNQFSNATIFCLSAGAIIKSLDTTINISSYNITKLEDGHDLISIPGEGFHTEEGKYVLPSVSTEILLPNGAELYSVNLTSCTKIKLPYTYNLPICHMVTISDEPGGIPQPQDYNSYGNSTYSVFAIENLNGTKTITIQISPVEYCPDNGTAYLYTVFNFSIKYLMSNTYMSNMASDKLRYEPGEKIHISGNIMNSGVYSLSNLNVTTVVIGENATVTNTSTIPSISVFSMGGTSIEIWNGSINEGGYYRISAEIKDSSNNTLDIKHSTIRVTKEPEITISTIFLEQNANITEKIDKNKPFNLTIAVDNIGDYNASDVIATINLPPNVYTSDNLTKNVNTSVIPGFESNIVKWKLHINDSGNHTVSLIINSANGGSDTKQFTFNTTNPIVNFSWTPENPHVSEQIQFLDASNDSDGTIVNWTWDFGDGATSYNQNTSHSYSNDGSYSVTLTIEDDFGATATLTKQILINDNYNGNGGSYIPIADANGPYTGYVNHPVTFSSVGSIGGSGRTITAWYWTFGDGAVSSQQNPTHTYASEGTFTVTLKVTNNYSQTDTDTTTATITKLSSNQTAPDLPTIVISVDATNIEPIQEENEMVIPVTVFCYHQTVSNIHLEILESSNFSVTVLSPSITLNPGESNELLINIKAPKLEKKDNSKDSTETIILRAVGDNNIVSNTEQITIKIVEKATPGFEFIILIGAIVFVLLWRRKSRK